MPKQKIKPGEQVAIEYFRAKGYTNVIYEPDGQVPPDILLNNKIAVEVRRLNQFKGVNDVSEPLEKLEYKLLPLIYKTVKSFESVSCHKSCFVSFDFQRPLIVDKKLSNQIKAIFDAHLNFIDQHQEYRINENISLRFFPASKKFNKPFVFGSYHDDDGGGLVIGNVMDSLRLIIKEKEEKIKHYRGKYSTWWLALNDHIGNGLDEIDLQQLKEIFDIDTFFEKIIFISIFDSTYGTELVIDQNRNS